MWGLIAQPVRAAGRFRCLATATALIAGCAAAENTVRLETSGGDAWTFERLVSAEIPEGACDTVRFTSAVGSVDAAPQSGQVAARVPLGPGENRVEADCRKNGATAGSPAQQVWNVRLADTPKARVRTVPTKPSGMILDAGASTPAPVRALPLVAYEWREAASNPAPLPGLPASGKRIELRPPQVGGDYSVTLRIADGAGRTDETTTVFRVRDGRPEAIDLAREHPAWVDRAVIYGVQPILFGPRELPDVTARLDDLESLGITTLWLTPVTAASPQDFGYAVTDFFQLRPELGTAGDLRALIDGAHARGMRVILDFAVNHVSDQHPYFKDAKARGRASPYYDFFDRDAAGEATHYFSWANLINLNYDNPEVQRWIIEAFADWVRKFDVDGFRVDAAWGPRRRALEFWPRWRAELKRIKPDLLLLAEAPARDPYYFQGGFDVAYDWTDALGEWAWRAAFEDEAHTARRLRAAIAGSLAPDQSRALVLRFLDNNDTGARFITRYGVSRTRLAAAMLLTLPGVPEIYSGDEVGAEFEPYAKSSALDWTDRAGLRRWYTRLIALRAAEPALRSGKIRFLDIAPADHVLAYLRSGSVGEHRILVLLNWNARPVNAALPDVARREISDVSGMIELNSGARLPRGARSLSLPAYGVAILAGAPSR